MEKYITSELDFTREAANTQAAAQALRHHRGVIVPEVVVTTQRVLVTAFVDGLVRFDNRAALVAAGVRPRQLGEMTACAFASLAFEQCAANESMRRKPCQTTV